MSKHTFLKLGLIGLIILIFVFLAFHFLRLSNIPNFISYDNDFSIAGKKITTPIDEGYIAVPYYGNKDQVSVAIYAIDQSSFENLDQGALAAFEGTIPLESFTSADSIEKIELEVLAYGILKNKQSYLNIPVATQGYYYVEINNEENSIDVQDSYHWLINAK